MKIIYIAGPFRGKTQWEQVENIRRAERIALAVWGAGYVALCPHLNTANFQGALPDETWLKGDLELLKRCDAVLLVPGWEQSAGSRAEVIFAAKNNVHVFDNFSTMHQHFQIGGMSLPSVGCVPPA